MKPERFKRTKSVLATCAITLVVAALVMGVSSLVFGPRSPAPQHTGFDLTSNPSTFTITSAFYKTPSGPYPASTCSGSGALVPGVSLCVVFTITNALNVPISVTGITSALDSSYPTPPSMCMGSYLTLPSFSGSFPVPAGGSAKSPGVPITLKDSPTVNQGPCQGFHYHFTFSGTAQYTDATTTILTSAPNPSVLGSSVTFTATVTGKDATADSSQPTGTVSFYKCTSATVCPNTGTPLGTGTVGSGGKATYSTTTSQLTEGLNYVDAVYPASGTNFAGSTSNVVTQDVGAATKTVLTSSPDPSVKGGTVTFTATVSKTSGTGTPSGTVQFYLGTPGSSTLLGSGSLNASGQATYSTAGLPVSINHTYAVYLGDTNFSGSTSPVYNQIVLSSGCIGGTINGGYVVKAGFVCITARINGGLTVQPGAAVYLSGAQINGGAFSASASTTVVFCGSTINGNVSVTDTSGFVLMGDGADNTPGDDPLPACAANTINAPVFTVSNNHGGFEVGGNHFTGALTFSGNVDSSFQPEIEGNTITGSLSCTSNVLAPTDDNLKNAVTGVKSGQCGGSF